MSDDYDGPERRRRGLTWERVATLIALALAGWSTLGVASRSEETARLARENAQLARENANRIDEIAALDRRQAREARQRRDQSCMGDERDHLADVKRLRRTYRFLRSEFAVRQPDLVAIARQQLPEIEREARVDRAPAFCDEPGIGLKEPDPKIPKRPRGLTRP